MKASRYILIAGLLIGLSNIALAYPNVFVSIGSGQPGFRHNCRSGFKPGHKSLGDNHRRYKSCFNTPHFKKVRRCHIPHRKNFPLRSGYWYDRKPIRYVVTRPIIIEKQTVVTSTTSPEIVQTVEFDESTIELYKNLQHKKSKFLEQLQMQDKTQRVEAIKELAGFSFDDNVREALEDVLLSEPDPELRAEAARSFGKVKNKKALPVLEKVRVEDSSEDVRKAADEAIKKIKVS